MGYCPTCNEWCGYSYSYCDDKECETVRKLIGLYGIKKIGETLRKVYVRNDKAIDNRTENIEKIKEENKQMVLRSTEKK